MNYHQLETKIKRVVNKILASIIDPELKKLVEEKTFLTGGCFKAIWHNETVNDYDFYFVDRQSSDKFKELIDKGLSNSNKPFTVQNDLKLHNYFPPSKTTEFAMTFILEDEIKVQFITKYVGSPEEVTNRFDFQHAKNYYIHKTGKFRVDYSTLTQKVLYFNESASHPVHALKRLKKFIEQGWSIEDSELIKIAEAINRVDMDTYKNWKEQTAAMYCDYESNGIVIFNNNVALDRTKENLIRWEE